MVALTDLDALRPVAEEATRRLDGALAALAGGRLRELTPRDTAQAAWDCSSVSRTSGHPARPRSSARRGLAGPGTAGRRARPRPPRSGVAGSRRVLDEGRALGGRPRAPSTPRLARLCADPSTPATTGGSMTCPSPFPDHRSPVTVRRCRSTRQCRRRAGPSLTGMGRQVFTRGRPVPPRPGTYPPGRGDAALGAGWTRRGTSGPPGYPFSPWDRGSVGPRLGARSRPAPPGDLTEVRPTQGSCVPGAARVHSRREP